MKQFTFGQRALAAWLGNSHQTAARCVRRHELIRLYRSLTANSNLPSIDAAYAPYWVEKRAMAEVLAKS